MIVTLHLCGPEGEVLRQQLSDMLNALKQDNRYVLSAMLNDGSDVPDTVIDAGLEYVPSRHHVSSDGEPIQVYYGMRSMFDSGTFSCAEGAAYEAAVLEEKYGVPTECVAVAFDDGDYHAIFVTPDGEVDPTENYLRHWDGQRPARIANKTRGKGVARPSGPTCRIVDGRVACETSTTGACVDAATGRWHAPRSPLHGKKAKIQEVFTGHNTRNRWAKTQTGVFVPICWRP